MADLKESGDIEQDADIIIFVHRDAYTSSAPNQRRPRMTDEACDSERREWHELCDKARGKASLIVAKNRQGRTGTADCAFDAKRQRFETLERWER